MKQNQITNATPSLIAAFRIPCRIVADPPIHRKRKLKPWISVPTPAWDNDSKAVVNHSKIGEMPCINLLLLNKSGLT